MPRIPSFLQENPCSRGRKSQTQGMAALADSRHSRGDFSRIWVFGMWNFLGRVRSCRLPPGQGLGSGDPTAIPAPKTGIFQGFPPKMGAGRAEKENWDGLGEGRWKESWEQPLGGAEKWEFGRKSEIGRNFAGQG